MLKTTRSSEELAPKLVRADSNKVVKGVGSRADKTIKNLPLSKMRVLNIGVIGEPEFLTSGAKKTFK